MMGMMRQARFAVLLVGAVAALASLGPAASASGLPRLLASVYCSGGSCTGVYKLRPRKVVLAVAAGGNLTKLVWSSWSATSASASGTAIDSNMGTTTKSSVRVGASRVRNGLYTRLKVTFMLASGSTQVETLKLQANQATWLPLHQG